MNDPTLPGQAPTTDDDLEQFSLFGADGDSPRETPPAESSLPADDLDAQAQALWEADPRAVKPAWSQLGDTTKGLWREYVSQGMRPEDWARPGWDQMTIDRPRGC